MKKNCLKKIPIEQRELTHKQLMAQLREEEVAKIKKRYPRTVDHFKAGDRVQITKYLDLADLSKTEVIKGMVIARRSNTTESWLAILNNKEDSTWEMKVPLNSPWIKDIMVLQYGNLKRRNAYYLRDRPVEEFQT